MPRHAPPARHWARGRQSDHLAGQRHRHLVQARLVGALAFQVFHSLDDFERVAIAAQNAVHVGDQRDGGQAGPWATATNARKTARHLLGVAERPIRTTSITSPSRPSATFFDGIELTINGMDSTVAVTSRVA
jgi:hypothetical protein